MACHNLPEFSSNPIISERVTNLNNQHSDLVHCPICSHILWKPVTCTSCENSFCFQCIQRWLFEQQEQIIECMYNENENDYITKSLSLTRCPFNCSPYQQRKCPPLLISILSKLTIECRNKFHGCQQILYYEQLEKHEEELCPYQIIQCPGCQQNMFKEIFNQDQHLLTCLYVEFECLKCQSLVKRKDKHTELDCMQKQICLLKQNMNLFEQKSFKIFDIQRKKIEILDQKIDIIEKIWPTDDDKQIKSVSTSTHLMENWRTIIGIGFFMSLIFILFSYIRSFFS
jgi:hypothetical protein